VLRTVTFSDPEVAAYINRNFVSAWVNRGPGFFNADFSTEKWIFAGSVEAYPTKNICTFFMAPDGKVFDYVAGTYAPELFLKVLKTAVELRQALFDPKMQLRDGGIEAAGKIHQARALSMAAKREQVDKAGPSGWKGLVAGFKGGSYRGQAHEHGSGCLSSLRSGYDYLARLHLTWSETAALPDFEEIRTAYLWGNPFTEESADAARIGDNDTKDKADPYEKIKDRPAALREEVPTRTARLGGRGVKIDTGVPPVIDLLSGK